MKLSSFRLKTGILVCSLSALISDTAVDAQGLRTYAYRTKQVVPNTDSLLSSVLDGETDAVEQLDAAVAAIQEEEDEMKVILEMMQQMTMDGAHSMAPSAAPSYSPKPSTSSMPSPSPSISSMPSVSMVPSETASSVPTVIFGDTAVPTGFGLPDIGQPPVAGGGLAPVEPTAPPAATTTAVPSLAPSISSSPSMTPTAFPSESPSAEPSASPSMAPSPSPSVSVVPTASPSAAPSTTPSIGPSDTPSASPTLAKCGMTPEERAARILAILDGVANPISLRDIGSMQGKAADWLINQDEYLICPDDPKVIQRFALAVIYFATNGDEWLQCSAIGLDPCGFEDPFVGDSRFLSALNECNWAGITCDPLMCVTEVDFELNNLVGTIPTEIALLSGLRIWGMERGGLTGKIPTEVGMLTNLIFIDLDFNQLTGSLSSELLSLSRLTQLDLNDNQMTGSIEGIGVFPSMEFLQLHNNSFTGTVPEAVGSFTDLGAFTLHESNISGVMPQSVCNLLRNASLGGVLDSLIADCGGLDPNILCNCCTDCRL